MCLTCALNVQGLPLTADRPFLPFTQGAFLRLVPSSCPQAGTTRSSPRSFCPAQEAWEGSHVLVSTTEPGKEQSQAEPQPAGCLTFSRELDSGSPRAGRTAGGVAGGQESAPALSQGAQTCSKNNPRFS